MGLGGFHVSKEELHNEYLHEERLHKKHVHEEYLHEEQLQKEKLRAEYLNEEQLHEEQLFAEKIDLHKNMETSFLQISSSFRFPTNQAVVGITCYGGFGFGLVAIVFKLGFGGGIRRFFLRKRTGPPSYGGNLV